MKILQGVLLCGLLSGGNVLAAEPVATLNVKYYDVTGSTAREIRDQLNERGPMSADGHRHDGLTRWYVSWTYQMLSEGGGHCEIRSPQIKVAVVMTLPKWKQPNDASERLAKQWEDYSAALRLHENGHYENGVAAARAIEQKIAGLSGASGCKALSHGLDAAAKAVISEYIDKDAEYDEKTKHGATQGARFPQRAREKKQAADRDGTGSALSQE